MIRMESYPDRIIANLLAQTRNYFFATVYFTHSL